MNAVAEAKRISNPEFCGFVWKQASADGKKGLAEEYYDNFTQLVSDLRADLGVADLPTFIPNYYKDEEILAMMLSLIGKEQRREARKLAAQASARDADALEAVQSYIDDNGLLETAKPMVKKQRYVATVVSAQNRAGRELPNIVTLFPGKLPIQEGGVHYSSEGYLMLGKATASAIEEYYKQ